MSNSVGKNELPPASRLSRIKAQFQQKQMQEKEHKLLQMLDNQQQRALQKAAINGVLPSKYSNNAYSSTLSTPGSNSMGGYTVQPGKVRQMFEERRKGGVLPSSNLYNSSSNGNATNGNHRNGGIIGIDKSYPLEPLVTPKSRSSSSKSDPNPTKTTSVRGNGVITKPPANLGSKRGVSLDRSNGTTSERAMPTVGASRTTSRDSSFTSTGAVLGGARSRASSGQSSHNDINANPLNIGRPLNTTKYSDIYGNEGESVAKREANLAMKMKRMNISGDSPASSPSPVRSASPPKRSPPSRPQATRSPVAQPAAAVAGIKKTAPASKPVPKGPPPPGMAACKVCGRHFATDRVEKHESICKKTSTKKRKVFDPTKMRMQGTEAEPYLRKVSAKATKAPVAAKKDQQKKSDWRKKHEEFIRTIRAAKEYQAHVDAGGNPADLPPPPPSDTSDYIQCPHCGRKFSEGAAERHIPKCKNIRSNKK